MIIKRKGALGDVIMMTPAIRQLRLNNPDMYIGIETFFPDVFKNNPYVSEASNKIVKRNEKIVVLDAYYEKNLDRHPVDCYADGILGSDKELLSKNTELFVDENDRIFVDDWMSQISYGNKKIIVIHFGTTWVPIIGEEFEKVLNFLRKKFIVVLIGRKVSDKEYYPRNLDNVIDLVDKEWSIHKIQWLIEKSDLFFGTDTGVMHIASTTNTPIVCCYSFVNPKNRIPFRDGVDFRSVHVSSNVCSSLFCAESNKKLCSNGDFGGVKCDKSFICAKKITSKMMIKAIKEIKIPFVD